MAYLTGDGLLTSASGLGANCRTDALITQPSDSRASISGALKPEAHRYELVTPDPRAPLALISTRWVLKELLCGLEVGQEVVCGCTATIRPFCAQTCSNSESRSLRRSAGWVSSS